MENSKFIIVINILLRIGSTDESLYNGLNTGNIEAPITFYCRCPGCPEVDAFNCLHPVSECTFDEFLDVCRTVGTDRNEHFREQCFERKKRSALKTNLASDLTDLDAPPFEYSPDYIGPVMCFA